MALINTTDTLNSSMHLKANLADNKVGDNYYIQTLQDKRNADWDYRFNKVWIDEELEKQIKYTKDDPSYTPIDVVIDHVKTDTGEVLSDDWCRLHFRELKHLNKLGKRYRFSYDFDSMAQMSEEGKHDNCSIWITVNKTALNAGNDCVATRCNNSFSIVGSPTFSRDNVTEIHYEPTAITSELKYINIYYNSDVPIPQAELYATIQMNYFTKGIKINDRIILSGVDVEDRENNSSYKVKAIVKSLGTNTFAKVGSSNIESIPLITLALDKDIIDEKDDFTANITDVSPMYRVIEDKPDNEYYLSITEPYEKKVLLGEEQTYECNLFMNGEVISSEIDYTAELQNTDYGEKYFILTKIDNTHFKIKNLSTYRSGNLIVTCSCNNPDSNSIITQNYAFELGGFY